MPAILPSGWTSGSIAPSYSLGAGGVPNFSGINGPVLPPVASGTGAPGISYINGVPQIPNAPPAVQGAIQNLQPMVNAAITGTPGGLPSIAPVLPAGWGGRGRGGGGGASDMVSPYIPMTPEQAYSEYLRKRIMMERATPLEAAQRTYNNATLAQAYSDPSNNVTALTQTPWQRAKKAEVNAAQLALLRASPYSYAYGTPSVQAPAPQPAFGYVSGYGQAPPGLQPYLQARSAWTPPTLPLY